MTVGGAANKNYLLNKNNLLHVVYDFSCIYRLELKRYVSSVDFSTTTQLVFLKGKI